MKKKLYEDEAFIKVIVWRVLSIVFCTLLGRLWFGDWHATFFGFVISVTLTIMHYYFEKIWEHFYNKV